MPKLQEWVTQLSALREPTVWRHLKKDGTVVSVEIRSHSLAFQGRPARLVMATDVTERLQASRQLRIQGAALQAAADGIVITTPAGVIEWVNPAFTRLTGYAPEEAIGATTRLLRSGQQSPEVYRNLWTTIQAGQVWRGLLVNRRSDGSLYTEEQTITPVSDEQGTITHYVAIKQDVTEREQARAALAASERRFRSLIDNSSDAITLITTAGTVVYDSPTAPRMLGYRADEWNGRSFFDLLHPDDLAPLRRLVGELLQPPGALECAIFRLRHKDGTWRWIEAVASNLLDEPAVGAIVSNYRDATERRRAEQALQASEKRFRALIEKAPDGITLVNADGLVSYTSPSTTRILGYTAAEAVGQDPSAFTHPADLPALLGQVSELAQRPGDTATVEYRFRHRDGAWRWLESQVTNLLAEPSVGAIIFNYRDVTERKHSEQQIQRQVARLQALRTIDRAITASLDLRVTLDVLLDQVVAQLGVDAADVLLLDPHSQALAFTAGRGFRTNVGQHTVQRLGEGHAGRVALERTLVHVPDLSHAEPRFTRTGLLSDENFVSYFGVPLLAKGDLKGVLEVFHRSVLTWDQDWQDFLEALAG